MNFVEVLKYSLLYWHLHNVDRVAFAMKLDKNSVDFDISEVFSQQLKTVQSIR